MAKKETPVIASSVTSAKTTAASPHNQVRQLRTARKWTQWQLAQISRLSERALDTNMVSTFGGFRASAQPPAQG